MPDKKLYIYGAGGLGREILSLVRSLGEWTPAGFIDDGVARNSDVGGLKVLGGSEVLDSLAGPVHLVLAIGDPVMKHNILKRIVSPGVVFPVLIHPSAILQNAETIRIGEGSVIAAGCALTTDIHIGKHVLINLNTTVGHDAHIGNYTSIMPGVNIAGEVIIGECVLVGSGANILNRMVVSDRSKVGMGAVVTRPVEPGSTVVGIPAKPIRR